MATEAFTLEIKVLSKEEAREVWQAQSRRAPNFQMYQDIIDQLDIGEAFDVTKPGGKTWFSRDMANVIKYNFTEAAKERHVTKTLDTAKVPEGYTAEKLVVDEREYTRQPDGSYTTRVLEPAIARFKQTTRQTKQQVTKDGKKGEVEVTEYSMVRVHLVSTEAVVKRAPRAKKADESKADEPESSANGKVTDDTPAPFESNVVALTPEQIEWAASLTDDQIKGIAEHAKDNADSAAEYNRYLQWKATLAAA